MGLRADWHEGAAPAAPPPGVDPFDMPSSAVVATLSIDTDSQKLFDRLRALVGFEGGLFNKEVTCAIKDRPETCCSVCPVSQSNGDSDKAFLCRIGVEQEQILTLLAAQDHGS